MTVTSSAILTIAVSADEFRRATTWLEEFGQKFRVPEDKIYGLNICLNEALANIFSYGQIDPVSSLIKLTLGHTCHSKCCSATLMVSDEGVAFDPLLYTPKPLPSSIEEATPGGGGIILMRTFADKLSYVRDAGCNQLSFSVDWERNPSHGEN